MHPPEMEHPENSQTPAGPHTKQLSVQTRMKPAILGWNSIISQPQIHYSGNNNKAPFGGFHKWGYPQFSSIWMEVSSHHLFWGTPMTEPPIPAQGARCCVVHGRPWLRDPCRRVAAGWPHGAWYPVANGWPRGPWKFWGKMDSEKASECITPKL